MRAGIHRNEQTYSFNIPDQFSRATWKRSRFSPSAHVSRSVSGKEWCDVIWTSNGFHRLCEFYLLPKCLALADSDADEELGLKLRGALRRQHFTLNYFSPNGRLISIIPFAAYTPATFCFQDQSVLIQRSKFFLAFFMIIRSYSNQCVNQRKFTTYLRQRVNILLFRRPRTPAGHADTRAQVSTKYRYSQIRNTTLCLLCNDIPRPQYCRFELMWKLQRNWLNPTSFRRISFRKQ